MYTPAHFAETDPAEIRQILEGAPLATLVAQTPQGLIANHLPLIVAPDGRLIGHVALANDLHRLVSPEQEVLAIFRANDGYVSANAYPSKAEHHKAVPTWNYQVAHVHGHLLFQHEEQQKRAAVGLLTRLHERRVNGTAGWRMADAPADYMVGMLANIVAFELRPSRVLAKSKLSQNRTTEDFLGAAAALEASGSQATAAAMHRRAEKDQSAG